eukprot:6173587-Pleurochrysis_carterae.AAC.2
MVKPAATWPSPLLRLSFPAGGGFARTALPASDDVALALLRCVRGHDAVLVQGLAAAPRNRRVWPTTFGSRLILLWLLPIHIAEPRRSLKLQADLECPRDV